MKYYTVEGTIEYKFVLKVKADTAEEAMEQARETNAVERMILEYPVNPVNIFCATDDKTGSLTNGN